MGASLINSSVCLSALFISYLVSYYVTEDDWACTIFSAIFHYSFLVTSISLLILALLKTLQPEKLGKIFLVLLLVQFSENIHLDLYSPSHHLVALSLSING